MVKLVALAPNPYCTFVSLYLGAGPAPAALTVHEDRPTDPLQDLLMQVGTGPGG